MPSGITHDCGVRLETGEYTTYQTSEERVMWVGTAVVFEGECPACGEELDPEEDRFVIEGA